MSKPKEFYVKPTRERNGLKSYTATVAPINVAGEIRVIEYSAYQALERKLEVAIEKLNDFRDHGTRHDTTPTGMFKECGCFDSFKKDNWQGYIKSQDEYVRQAARQALAEIKGEL